MPTEPKPLKARISARIATSKADVFVPADFAELGRYGQVLRALRQLVADGVVGRMGYGVYLRLEDSIIPGVTGRVPTVSFDGAVRQALAKLGVEFDETQTVKDYNAGRTTQVQANCVLVLRDKGRFRRKLAYDGMVIGHRNLSTRLLSFQFRLVAPGIESIVLFARLDDVDPLDEFPRLLVDPAFDSVDGEDQSLATSKPLMKIQEEQAEIPPPKLFGAEWIPDRVRGDDIVQVIDDGRGERPDDLPLGSAGRGEGAVQPLQPEDARLEDSQVVRVPDASLTLNDVPYKAEDGRPVACPVSLRPHGGSAERDEERLHQRFKPIQVTVRQQRIQAVVAGHIGDMVVEAVEDREFAACRRRLHP